jgi:hypothetical protein
MMKLPIFMLDSREQWKPVSVEESLGAYGYNWSDGTWQKGGKKVDKIDFPADMKPADFDAMAIIGYHRVARGGGLHWHQFWTWWPYNPKVYAGQGAHEGDWEMVQFGCTDTEGDNPILATYSAHSGNNGKCFWDVELTEGKRGDPVVYVARDSHANYFTPVRTVTDQADGQGKFLDIAWLEFGVWAKWPGKWGNSENSPGQLANRQAWQAPHAYHSKSQ